MASFLPRNGKETSGGGGGGDGRKRLSSVEEGDEALELAKLDAMEQDVQKLEEKVKSVETRIADIETKMTRLDETEGASFDDLNAFQKKIYKSALAYSDSLEQKHSELVQQLNALHHEIGGAIYNRGAQRAVVSEVRSRKIENKRFKVCGTFKDSKSAKGVRRFVYSAIANNAGFAEVTEDTDASPHRRAIRYEGGNPPMDLTFEIIFTTLRDAAMFSNEIMSNSLGYNTDHAELSPPEVVYVANIQNIHSRDYHSDDEPGSLCSGDSDSSVYTAVEADGDLAMFQSIEIPICIREGMVDCAHLVHKTSVAAVGIEDDDNNRLALSVGMRHMFDGRRNQFPQIMIEPAPDFSPNDNVTATDHAGENRVRTWVKVTVFDPNDCKMISFYVKEGTKIQKRSDGFTEFFTFVFVKDRDQFYENLQWKATETESHWKDARSRRG
mmetsp:Transcript_5900/g.12045  ORF Transcript_5900/g.12045 Transcript_5900/m.12045 type:complete len:440 (+) Transcript_5900:133-1452(+)